MTQVKEVPAIWTTGWTDVLNTGTWRSVIPVHQQRPSPCHNACPAGGDIPRWVQLAAEKDYYAAWLALLEHNPFPAVTGRVCHHPCEASCNRGRYDGPVAVKALEQFIGDLALAEGWELPAPAGRHPGKIAVIGGGPAGLSCAYQLARRGYAVDVREARPELGGVLRYGIPEYRLPKEVLRREIQRLFRVGVTARTDSVVDADALERLAGEYDALFLAPGAGQSKQLDQLDAGLPWVVDGLEFLEQANRGQAKEPDAQVVVIGGGSSAMDVARTARRLGSQVKVIALETRDIMPAQAEEVEEALEEGITLLDGVMLASAAPEERNLLRLECTKVVLEREVPPGVLKPVALPGTGFTLQANAIILAIGQEPDAAAWQPVLESAGGLIAVDRTWGTSRRGVYAGGDAASRHRFVTAALGAGKQAACSIARSLGEPVTGAADPAGGQEVAWHEINTFYFPRLPRAEKGRLSPAERLAGFREVRAGLAEREALAEAGRCFSCGNCVQCDNCFYFCPDMAVVRSNTPGGAYSVLEQYCKGCGMCVEECPRGAVALKEETR